MNSKEVLRVANRALCDLSDALDRGESKQLTEYLEVMGRFHQYSLGNQVLIASQRPQATRVAGFFGWRRLGRRVNKGERGIRILAPITVRKRTTSPNHDAVSQNQNDQHTCREIRIAFHTAHVFDIEQTSGPPLPTFPQVRGNPGVFLERLCKYAFDNSIKLEYTARLGGAEGISLGGKILLKTSLDSAAEFGVLTHELAHELMHHDGLKRSTILKETEAEAVAYVVGCAVGLNFGTHSSDYVRLHRGDAKTLGDSLGRIRDTAVRIINAVLDDSSPNRQALQPSASQSLPAGRVEQLSWLALSDQLNSKAYRG
jgi:hypothetical protein